MIAAFARRKPRVQIPPGPLRGEPGSFSERIFKTVWELRKQGYAKATIDGYGRKLKTLSRIADLQTPESVRSVIALKDCSVAFKEALCNAYDHYVRVNGLAWVKPFYKRQRGLPYVAKSEQIAKIVARASRKYALIFTLLAETGLRPIEASLLTLRNIDLDTGILSVKSAKNGNPRNFKLKTSTLAMFNSYVQQRRFRLKDKLFPNASAIRHSFARYRGDLAVKLHDISMLKIRLYDLRHYYATMLYHRTKDILHVKQQLGHKRLENTLIYTHLVNFGNDDFVCKVAETVQEATALIANGFEYVTEIERVKLFRKTK